jgi:PadR family transcriptional regulator PadR
LTNVINLNHNVILIMLGEFEYLMLTVAARLGEGAYGAAMRLEIEDATGRPCSIGALYTTLDRLEAKGFVKTHMGDPTPERGGRAKRIVRITPKGVHAASEFYEAVKRISRGVSWEANRIAIRIATR